MPLGSGVGPRRASPGGYAARRSGTYAAKPVGERSTTIAYFIGLLSYRSCLPQDTAGCLGGRSRLRFPSMVDPTWPVSVPVLTVASSGADPSPTVRFDQLDRVAHLRHPFSIGRGPYWAVIAEPSLLAPVSISRSRVRRAPRRSSVRRQLPLQPARLWPRRHPPSHRRRPRPDPTRPGSGGSIGPPRWACGRS